MVALCKATPFQKIFLSGCAMGGLSPTLTFFMRGLVLTSSVRLSTFSYSFDVGDIFIADTLSPGVVVCLAYVFTMEEERKCFTMT
uniref:Uncharacterized protein n=1 Tax=Romanomermis culicivorax TaxID=13658 RepID=A0A915IMZ4_ROMCU